MPETLTLIQQSRVPSVRNIWILATSRESGIETTIHATELEAYEKLAGVWFPNFDRNNGSEDDIANHTAMLAALGESLDTAKQWFEDYQLNEDTPGDAIIESHVI